jgi:phosphomevalonate kinase
MRVVAPGKLLLTGAYCVLYGAPAVVVAIDRYAVADSTRENSRCSNELRLAFAGAPAPHVDVSALHDQDGRKLGLGSSAASLVAALGVRTVSAGGNLSDEEARRDMFDAARRIHAEAQGGGSGVDVAASVYGGVLRYRIDSGSKVHAHPLVWPRSLVLAAFDSGTSARTSDLLVRVAAHHASNPVATVYEALRNLACRADVAFGAGEVVAFIAAAREFGEALEELGKAAGAPIVPARFASLAGLAAEEGAAFIPSGAGGGDMAVWLSRSLPSPEFTDRAAAMNMRSLPLSLDYGGVRTEVSISPRALSHGANL